MITGSVRQLAVEQLKEQLSLESQQATEASETVNIRTVQVEGFDYGELDDRDLDWSDA